MAASRLSAPAAGSRRRTRPRTCAPWRSLPRRGGGCSRPRPWRAGTRRTARRAWPPARPGGCRRRTLRGGRLAHRVAGPAARPGSGGSGSIQGSVNCGGSVGVMVVVASEKRSKPTLGATGTISRAGRLEFVSKGKLLAGAPRPRLSRRRWRSSVASRPARCRSRLVGRPCSSLSAGSGASRRCCNGAFARGQALGGLLVQRARHRGAAALWR